MRFEKTKEMKITVLPEQEKMLSSKKEIRKACMRKDVISFDIFNENTLVGFVMLRKFAEHSFFYGIMLLIINIRIANTELLH